MLILSQKSSFGVYLPYCKNKPTSDTVRVEYDPYFTSRQNELGHKLSIEDLLIAPVQRLPKYHLLIKVRKGEGIGAVLGGEIVAVRW